MSKAAQVQGQLLSVQRMQSLCKFRAEGQAGDDLLMSRRNGKEPHEVRAAEQSWSALCCIRPR